MKYLTYLLLGFVEATILYIAECVPITPEDEFESEPSTRSGNIVGSWNDTWEVNADELGYYFQGDIITSTAEIRSVIINETSRWPSAIVPYVIAGPYSDEGWDILEWAINQFHEFTCIRFIPKQPDHMDYLYITNTFTGCWSSLGRQGGTQEVNLQHPGCLSMKRRGTAVHELMHALGIKHEHTRVDRDNHVIVLADNIAPHRSINFEKSKEGESTNYDVPYDFGSVMHYSQFAFSTKFGVKPTLQPQRPQDLEGPPGTVIKMGQRRGFSVNDINKLNKMYCTNYNEIRPGPYLTLRKNRRKHKAADKTSVAEWWKTVIKSLEDVFF